MPSVEAFMMLRSSPSWLCPQFSRFLIPLPEYSFQHLVSGLWGFMAINLTLGYQTAAQCIRVSSLAPSHTSYAKSMNTPSDLINASKYLWYAFLCLVLGHVLCTVLIYSSVPLLMATFLPCKFSPCFFIGATTTCSLRLVSGLTYPLETLLSHKPGAL